MENQNNVNALIAKKATEFIKSRMLITQEIIADRNKAKGPTEINSISFEEFMAQIKEAESAQDGKRRHELVSLYADSLIIPEDKIDELMGIVKESIEQYGIGDTAHSCNEVFFLRGVLRECLEKKGDELGALKENDEEYRKIDQWTSFVYLTQDIGIDSRISGRVSIGYGDTFSISNSDNNTICKIGKDGTDKMEGQPEVDEEILLAKNLYVGELYSRNEGKIERQYSILNKVRGTDSYRALYGDDTVYTENPNVKGECVIIDEPLNDYISARGLGAITEEVYKGYRLNNIIRALDRSNSISREEAEVIEQQVGHAVDWWVDAVRSPKFDNGDKSEIGLMTMLLAGMKNMGKEPDSDKTIDEFRYYLGGEIRLGLYINPNNFSLGVDYHPDMCLSNAARKANFTGDFPWKTGMSFYHGEVSVRCGYGAPSKTIYPKKQHDKDEDFEGPGR